MCRCLSGVAQDPAVEDQRIGQELLGMDEQDGKIEKDINKKDIREDVIARGSNAVRSAVAAVCKPSSIRARSEHQPLLGVILVMI